MKSFGYILLILAMIALGVIWQILRRASAGAQAFINPERYAIQKVVEMQQIPPISLPEEAITFPLEKWNALVRYDPEIAPLAELLRPFGDKWVRTLGRDFFALQEDRSYLPHILRRLMDEAQRERAQEAKKEAGRKQAEKWSKFRKLYNGELCDDNSFAVLGNAESRGYTLSVEASGTIAADLPGRGVSYLRSNSDILNFGNYMATPPPDISRELSGEAISALRKASDNGYEVSLSPDKSSVVIIGDDGWRTSFSSEAEIIKFGRSLRPKRTQR